MEDRISSCPESRKAHQKLKRRIINKESLNLENFAGLSSFYVFDPIIKQIKQIQIINEENRLEQPLS